MANERKAITNKEEGAEYLRKCGKYDDCKFRIEKSNVREFYELAGAPKPVQDAMRKAEELLRGSIFEVGSELIRDEAAKLKKAGKTLDDMKDVAVQVTALDDLNTTRVKFPVCKDVRIPQSNEIVTKVGPVKYTIESKRTGVTKSDVENHIKMLQDIVSGK